jgi:hypothetical protein
MNDDDLDAKMAELETELVLFGRGRCPPMTTAGTSPIVV